MKVLVTGASGLIGGSIVARLAADGHEIVAAVRDAGAPLPLAVSAVVVLDMAQAGADDWAGHLAGIEAVVNCVGVLQDSPREDVAVHARGAAALFEACARLGIRRVIHFSAIGVDRGAVSRFSESKYEGDQALMALDLDWVILRPSVVLGRPVFGASALFRGLAALPRLPLMGDTGELQVVQLNDVTDTVALFLTPGAPSRVALELAGPERLSMADIVALYRRWLGWPPARSIRLPGPVESLLYKLGDMVGQLGWRPPMRTTVRKEILRGAVGSPAQWTEITGIAPQSLSTALTRMPATVQERWFAKLYFLKALTFIVLSMFWLGTGIISLTVGYEIGEDLMHRTGAGALAGPSVIAGALADIVVGLMLVYRPYARAGLYGAIFLSLFYATAGTILLPELWAEPLGPLLKIWPILVLHFIALATLDER
ncbi:SDR family oxidoreductase [Rhodoligotrophos defluvii]|uniref:SDR family oxidoreductase n=1 Tax=Rhodoligotrophos defluvii TaxID=2561934 RepID=UPI0010C96184|nr:SDR family oxidoreductase [Rhodoligotrophos defluvii]